MLRSKSIHFTEIWNLTLIFNGIEAGACVGYCGGWKRALGLHYKEFCFKYCWGVCHSNFHPTLMFASKAGASSSVAPRKQSKNLNDPRLARQY
jgi:hypothetical protein